MSKELTKEEILQKLYLNNHSKVNKTMTDISPVLNPNEIEEAKKLLMEIRFDCIVKMYDFGQIQPEGFLFHTPKPLPPQYFILSEKFTLEFIKYEDEWEIGRAIKNAYKKLEDHIKQYENKKLNHSL